MTVYNVAPIRFSAVSMVTATLGSKDPEIGTRCTEGNVEYIFVYNAGTSQISPGFGATVSAITGYSVTVSSVTDIDTVVGVCRNVTLTTGTYGWLVTKGFTTIQMGTNNSCVTGGMLGIGVDGGFATAKVSANTDTAMGPIVGKALTSVASAGSGLAYIRTFFA